MPNQKVLILGGGSGANLKHLDPRAHITFVELSKVMIEKARLRGIENIEFVNSDFLRFSCEEKFDWVICAFFLDVFEESELDEVIRKAVGFSHPKTQWLVSDFQSFKGWHSVFANVMYLFFKLTTNMKPTSLLQIHKHLSRRGLREKEAAYFFKKFIFSRRYSFD
ncbi:MAG: class I SAM-dependent methyltransferase [Cyclobacteriaceae bacterium]